MQKMCESTILGFFLIYDQENNIFASYEVLSL